MAHHKLFLLGLAFALAACSPIPDRINFSSDRRIFRGVYSGTGVSYSDTEKMPIRVEVSPQYIDGKNYKVTGVITLNEETAVPFEGEVFGGDTQLYVLTEPIIPPNFEAEFSYRGDRWTLSGAPTREDGYGPGQVPWYVGFGPVVDSSVGVRYQTTLKPAD